MGCAHRWGRRRRAGRRRRSWWYIFRLVDCDGHFGRGNRCDAAFRGALGCASKVREAGEVSLGREEAQGRFEKGGGSRAQGAAEGGWMFAAGGHVGAHKMGENDVRKWVKMRGDYSLSGTPSHSRDTTCNVRASDQLLCSAAAQPRMPRLSRNAKTFEETPKLPHHEARVVEEAHRPARLDADQRVGERLHAHCPDHHLRIRERLGPSTRQEGRHEERLLGGPHRLRRRVRCRRSAPASASPAAGVGEGGGGGGGGRPFLARSYWRDWSQRGHQ
eukprot:SAG31_NODE_560_length_14088_cov_10.467010_7_plen_273_part_01